MEERKRRLEDLLHHHQKRASAADATGRCRCGHCGEHRVAHEFLVSTLLFQALLQAVTESCGDIECLAIADQTDNVACSIENRSTVFAPLEMFLHSLAECGIHEVVDIIRYLSPNVNATDFYSRQVTMASLSSSVRPRYSKPRRIMAPEHRASSTLPATTES